MPPTNNGSTEDVPPPVVPIVNHESISKPANAPVSASRPNQKASSPCPFEEEFDERTKSFAQSLNRSDIAGRLLKNDGKVPISFMNLPDELNTRTCHHHIRICNFLEGDDKLPVIIAKDLKNEEKAALIEVLKSHKRAIAWKLSDIKGINPEFCTHKILMEEDYEPTVQHQRRVNPKIHDVIKKEVEKLLDAGLIYPISDSPWVSPVHCVPKKGGMTVVKNDENDLIPTRLVTGWRNILPTARMPFWAMQCTWQHSQRCMMQSSMNMIRKRWKVFYGYFSVLDSFSTCLSHLDKMLKRCEDTNLVLNWEKSHFMVKEGIVLGHKISKSGIEVDRAKVDVIAKLPHPTTIESCPEVFLGHAGFYRRYLSQQTTTKRSEERGGRNLTVKRCRGREGVIKRVG
ncbi:hypothetical protein Tco_0795132 [Tanacetum coccineum]